MTIFSQNISSTLNNEIDVAFEQFPVSDYFVIKNVAYSNYLTGLHEMFVDIFLLAIQLSDSEIEYFKQLNETEGLKCCWTHSGPSGHI